MRVRMKMATYYMIALTLCFYVLLIAVLTLNRPGVTKRYLPETYPKETIYEYYYNDEVYNSLLNQRVEYMEPEFDPELLEMDPESIVASLKSKIEESPSGSVYPLPQKVYDHFLRLEEQNYTDNVLILTPIQNVGGMLYGYRRLLRSLTYPRHLLSVALGEDGSEDDTLQIARDLVLELRQDGFRQVDVHHFVFEKESNFNRSNRHDEQIQYERRRHIAKARNKLLKTSLGNQSWVLWIDSDVAEVPGDVVQQLLFADRDVIVPCCLSRGGFWSRVYDLNTWRETPASLAFQETMNETDLMLQGYYDTGRLFLPHLRPEGRVVPIDGVGGCVLLVRAQCHKEGLHFPEEIYKHHIETEGLAKLAADMGYGVYGLPYLEAFH